MKRYFAVYKRLLMLNIAMLTAYRLNFFNYLVSGSVWGIFSIASIVLLTSRVTTVYSWEKSEILLLTAVHAITVGIFHMLFSSNFERFPRYVALGQLDSYLLKPIDSQVLVSIWLIRIVSLSRVIMGVGFLLYVITTYAIPVTPWQYLLLIPAIILGLSIMYAIWFMITTLSIWFYRITNITEVLYTLNGITRFPPDILREAALYVFLFLFPLTIIVASPTKILLSRISLSDVFFLCTLSLGLVYLSRRFWLFALRSYTSASS